MKEALCYLPPEQTGSIETTHEDARTDLYSLGVLFWSLIVGRGTLPFEGGPLEMLHACVHSRPVPVHEVRRDSVPLVLSQIVERLLAKNADQRYQSAYGLKVDLLECQRRLLTSVSSASDQSLDVSFSLSHNAVPILIISSSYPRSKSDFTIVTPYVLLASNAL